MRHVFASLLLSLPLSAQDAWLIDSQVDQLFAVDLQTGALTLVGSTLNNGLTTPADLCWRDDTNEVFCVDLAGGEVGRLDLATATFYVRWNTGISGFQAMAWDPVARRFWLHHQNNTLHSLDPRTGAVALIGTTDPPNLVVTSLEVDAAGQLWALDAAGAILRMDRGTGAATQVATTTAGMQGLAIDRDGTWFAVNAMTDSLYRIDPGTGVATLVGPNLGAQLAKGIVVPGTAVQRGGTACTDGAGVLRRASWSGDSNLGGTLQMGIDAGPAPRSTVLLLGFSASQAGSVPLPLDLAPFGAPGCRLFVSGDAIAGPVPSGTPIPVPIPALPSLVGMVVFAQGVLLDPGPNANAAGLASSDFTRIVVRV